MTLYHEDRPAIERQLGLHPSQMDVDRECAHEVQDALENFWLPKTAAYTDQYPWYTNWEIVLKTPGSPSAASAASALQATRVNRGTRK
jgi:uncharacterized cysteine cluster protein YcgN (CxxCxxCC family)